MGASQVLMVEELVPLFEMTADDLIEHKPETFAHLAIKEREDLQRILRDHISVLGDELLVISEEFGSWEDARRRIDLLALDSHGQLVVIELKRTESGGHMDLQALRYAAMVSAMTFDQVTEAYEAYRARRGDVTVAGDAAIRLREFLDAADEEPEISTIPRIVLVAQDFSREITTTVLWLNRFEGMDIRCVRLVPYVLGGQKYLDIEQVIPLPEAADYQIGIRRKEQHQQASVGAVGSDWTRYQIVADGHPGPPQRKRQAVLTMVQQLNKRGISMSAISTTMPPSRLRIISGELHDPEDVAAAMSAAGVSEPGRYFTEAPFVEDGNTYILTKMWGRGTVPALTALQEAFPDAGVSFQAEA